jgi:hypothetical protein
LLRKKNEFKVNWKFEMSKKEKKRSMVKRVYREQERSEKNWEFLSKIAWEKSLIDLKLFFTIFSESKREVREIENYKSNTVVCDVINAMTLKFTFVWMNAESYD